MGQSRGGAIIMFLVSIEVAPESPAVGVATSSSSLGLHRLGDVKVSIINMAIETTITIPPTNATVSFVAIFSSSLAT
jgi:hypothetical protein